MDSDWTIACGANDPLVVLPWNNADGSLHFIDLRENPDALFEIPEARQYPAMVNALRRWNQPDTGVFTAKCDVWDYPARLFDSEDLTGFAYARGSYVDMLLRDHATFSNFERCESLLKMWNTVSRKIPLAEARAEWVLRPAQMHPSADPTATHGYAITCYAWGYGESPKAATLAWSNALFALAEFVK